MLGKNMLILTACEVAACNKCTQSSESWESHFSCLQVHMLHPISLLRIHHNRFIIPVCKLCTGYWWLYDRYWWIGAYLCVQSDLSWEVEWIRARRPTSQVGRRLASTRILEHFSRQLPQSVCPINHLGDDAKWLLYVLQTEQVFQCMPVTAVSPACVSFT